MRTSQPATCTLPAVGGTTPARTRIVVDLPAPLRPSRAVEWPASACRSTPATASTSPKRTCRLRTSTTGWGFTEESSLGAPVLVRGTLNFRPIGRARPAGVHRSPLSTVLHRVLAGLSRDCRCRSVGWRHVRDRDAADAPGAGRDRGCPIGVRRGRGRAGVVDGRRAGHRGAGRARGARGPECGAPVAADRAGRDGRGLRVDVDTELAGPPPEADPPRGAPTGAGWPRAWTRTRSRPRR